ncbi:MAG TPA: sulfatase [Planctomycetota bacterium]
MRRISPAWARGTSILAVTAALAACGQQAPVPAPPEGPPANYDLAAELGHAERRTELERLDFSSFEVRWALRQGWAFPERPLEGAGRAELWSDAPLAEIELHVAQPCQTTVSTEVRGFVLRGEASPAVARLNGVEIARFELTDRWEPLALTLPAELQVRGENRLAFEFAAARTAAELHGGESRSGLRFSAQFRPLVLERADPVAAARLRWEAERLPEGLALRPLSDGESAIEMASGATARFHLEVPAAARFHARLALVAAQAAGPATFRVRVTPRGGPSEVLWEGPVARGELGAADVSLERFQGRLVRLALELEGASGRGAIGTWVAPVVRGGSAAGPPLADAADAWRRELARAPVVAILLDACRADVLSCYGGRPGLTPQLDRIAAEGARFERAHAVASYTMASVSSMLSERFTWEHGTYWESHRLPETFRTWPECFRDQGYRTVALVHSLNGSSRVGFERGFEEMIEVYRERSRPGREVVYGEEVLPPLARVLAADDERPLFLWLHLIEPHRPYDPPAPWRGSLTADAEPGLDGGVLTARRIKNRELVPSAAEMARMKAHYEENLAYADAVVGDVRRALEAAGLFDEAVVCVFSDHGEAFLEHDGKSEAGIGHGATTYQEMLRVPLLIRLPSRLEAAARRPDTLASGLDILPTLGDLVGVRGPAGGQGRSLVPALADPGFRAREDLVAHAYCPREDRFLTMWGYWRGDHKLVYQSGSLPALFDLAGDPGEGRNRVEEDPVLLGYLLEGLQRRLGFDPRDGLRGGPDSQEIEVDAVAMEMLQALGYGQ